LKDNKKSAPTPSATVKFYVLFLSVTKNSLKMTEVVISEKQ